MGTTVRSATLRVRNNNVGLGSGKSLPPGDYQGTITTAHFGLHGQAVEQIAKVTIYLSEEFLAEIFGDQPRQNSEGIDADFTASFKKGDIVEIA